MTTTPAPRGALVRLSAESVRAALRLPARGAIYDLGMAIDQRMPQDPDERLVPFSLRFTVTPEESATRGPFEVCAEGIAATLHTSTHLDALVHVQGDGRIFGGAAAADARDDEGWKQHGVETVPPIVGRCVLLDVASRKGVEALPDGYAITVTDLEAVCTERGVEPADGDVVLVRTGKIRSFRGSAEAYLARAPGVSREAAVWLYERGMAVLGTDTAGTEPMPFADPAYTLHRAMLVDRGVHLIENVYLEQLAADGVVEALFVCLPLKITGATASWVRPVAIT